MVNISDVFIGTKQSRYAGIAIFSAIIIVCISILFTNTDISLGQRIGIVLFIILTSIPSVFLSLFELTCIVTGGNPKTHVLCHYFAWIVAFIIIIYSAIIIISVILSMFTYNSAMDKVIDNEQSKKISKDEANKIAANMISSTDKIEAPSQPAQASHAVQFPASQMQQAQPMQQQAQSYQQLKEKMAGQSPSMVPSAYSRSDMVGSAGSFGNDDSFMENSLSISQEPVIPNNMNFNASGGSDNYNSPAPSEWRPMTVPTNIKPLTNNDDNLSTDGRSTPEPYSEEKFSLF
jgi:hypothetical protein